MTLAFMFLAIFVAIGFAASVGLLSLLGLAFRVPRSTAKWPRPRPATITLQPETLSRLAAIDQVRQFARSA